MSVSLVLGFFDGVHLGHQSVLDCAVKSGDSVKLITLEDSPSLIFCGQKEYILSRQNSFDKIKSFGIEVFADDFTDISTMSADEYLEMLIKKYSPSTIVTGFNYTYGYKKQGTTSTLEENQDKYNYNYICVPPFTLDDEIVSSTLIRDYLKSGDIKKANKLLGSEFILEGTVVHGAGIGKLMGFPTANIYYPQGIVEIPFGVYGVKVENYIGLMNYGIKPTFEGSHAPIAEIHLPGFYGDLYNKTLRIKVEKRIREEKKFNHYQELIQQIKKDIKECYEL